MLDTTQKVGAALAAASLLWWALWIHLDNRRVRRQARIDACTRDLHYHPTTASYLTCPCNCHHHLGES